MKKILLALLLICQVSYATIHRGSGDNFVHIFVGTKSKGSVYLGNKLKWSSATPPTITAFTAFPSSVDLDADDNDKTSSVTFVKQSTGIYHYSDADIRGQPTDLGSKTGFPSLRVAQHYYIGTQGRNSAVPSGVHYYQFSIDNRDPNYRQYTSVVINGRTYALTNRGSDDTTRGITTHTYWTTTAINGADTVTDGRLTIAFRFKITEVSPNLRLDWNITSATSVATTLTRLSDHSNIAFTGSSVTTTLRKAPTSYRLTTFNRGGSVHRDIEVNVTKDPELTNCRFLHVINQTHTYTFGFNVSGLPRPTVTFAFENSISGTVVHNLFNPGANLYTWVINNFTETLPTSDQRKLTLTATNASGTDTCELNVNP